MHESVYIRAGNIDVQFVLVVAEPCYPSKYTIHVGRNRYAVFYDLKNTYPFFTHLHLRITVNVAGDEGFTYVLSHMAIQQFSSPFYIRGN